MSFFSSFTKRPTLDAAIKQVAQARKSEAGKAEQLYKGAYQGFAKVIADNQEFSDALYHWGFALLHEAKQQRKEQAIETLEDAVSKFSFCLLTAPNYLGAAIDGGVAFMELARISEDDSKNYLYRMAEQFFEKACQIQKGSAAYNLACIYALQDDQDACLAALQVAKDYGSLPDEAHILPDLDMQSVIDQPWFKEFLAGVVVEEAPKSRIKDVEIHSEPTIKIIKGEDFDYYGDQKNQLKE